MSLTEKIAYIKGVVEGMNFDASTNEGKIIELLIDLLDDIANDVTDIYESTETMNAYIEEIDGDLSFLEDIVYDDFDDCDFDYENEDYNFFKVVCPSCNEEVYLDDSIDPSRVFCPSCHNEFSAEVDN